MKLLLITYTVLGLAAAISAEPVHRAAIGRGDVWWEGEKPSRTNFPEPKGEEGTGAYILSQDIWIGVDENWTETPFLEYEIEAPETGTYDLFVRKFWKHGPFRWRFDEQPWRRIGNDIALLDDENIRRFWCANWVHMGQVTLDKGRHTLRIEVTDNVKPAYFDCFLLTPEPFYPMGEIKPGAPLPPAPEGWHNFNQYDTLFDPSPIDLRHLNENQAGDRGFIGVKGESFVQAGEPIRFMAVGSSQDMTRMPRAMIDRQAKFLARKGVNMVRFHSPFFYRDGPYAGEIIEKDLDDLFYYITALKKEGIFTHLSIYFPVWFKPAVSGRFAGYKGEDRPFAIQFFSKPFQGMMRDWWRALLSRNNPYTGLPLCDDPCIMGLELLNEDSFFFWTFNPDKIPAEQRQILERMFAGWAEKKYGSLEKALAAWDAPIKHDAPDAGRLGFVYLWDMVQRRNLRDQDTARFLAEVQRAFFDDMYAFMRNEIGFKAVMCASNWRTANTHYLGAIEKWTNAGCDFMDHHGYYGAWGKHEKDGTHYYAERALSAWATGPGEDRHVLQLPFLPATIAGKPGMVSEYAWTGRNACRTEMPLIVSALASQAGLDAMVLFALSSTPAWRSNTKHSWPILTPSSIAQFPAKALVFRKALVRETAPQSVITVNIDDMLDLSGNGFSDPSANDANRAGEGKDTSVHGLETPCFAIGKVAVVYDAEKPNDVVKPNLAKLHDPEKGRLISASGQIDWPYKKGLFIVKAPQTQGVSGYLQKAGRIELPDLDVEATMRFGVVWAVAMDEQPLAQSAKILLQVMSEEKNYKLAYEGDLKRKLLDNGQAPIQVADMGGRVRFTRADAAALKVRTLDINGCPKGDAGSADLITLQPDTLYYLIEK